MHGDSVAWAIEHRGIVSFCVELWNGMEHVLKMHDEDYDHTADLGAGPVSPNMVGTREEDFVRLYKWLDENPPSDADRLVGATDTFVQPWTVFDHPQLGPVEIGGLDSKRCVQNPPASLLEVECEKNTAFSLALLGSLPSVTSAVGAEALTEEGAARVTLTLSNAGFL